MTTTFLAKARVLYLCVCWTMEISKITKLLSLLSPEQRTIRFRRRAYPLHWKSNQKVPCHLKTLGDHIKQQRLRLHLPQAELAKQLGVQAVTIYHWEHGVCDPSRRFFLRIIRFLGYDPRSSSVFGAGPQTAQPAEPTISTDCQHSRFEPARLQLGTCWSHTRRFMNRLFEPGKGASARVLTLSVMPLVSGDRRNSST
jgi:DNA-binding XRE family transcriptional regulator